MRYVRMPQGGTLSKIAQQEHMSLNAIRFVNPNLDPRRIPIGAKIAIPETEEDLLGEASKHKARVRKKVESKPDRDVGNEPKSNCGKCKYLISRELLGEIFKTASKARLIQYYKPINEALCLLTIKDKKSLAYFFGQASAETGDLKYTEEQGNNRYLSRYNGRKDLGNIYPGDGPRFKGRGLIQLTGRDNYIKFQTFARKKIQKYKKLDITSSTSAAQKVGSNRELNVLASLWYWFYGEKSSSIKKYVQKDDIFWVSVKVNGWRKQQSKDRVYKNRAKEPNHMKIRIERTKIARTAMGV